jgi:hypothetical protein
VFVGSVRFLARVPDSILYLSCRNIRKQISDPIDAEENPQAIKDQKSSFASAGFTIVLSVYPDGKLLSLTKDTEQHSLA